MPGLSFSNQNQGRRPGGWLAPVVLILVSVVLVTVSARVGNTGAFAAVRGVVHSVQSPLQQATSALSAPFKSIGNGSGASSMSADDVASLQSENQQLRALVSQLEEYRQQDQRLNSLMGLSDTYALQTVSATAVSTKSGWEQTATISAGSANGVQVGMGVMSSCGLYGQVISVTENNAVVRLITDANSSVSAMIQGTRSTGIVTGSYDGTLTMSYVNSDSAPGEGDVVITSGEGGSYPRGIILGTVSSVERDSSKLYYNLTVQPIYSIMACEEVLVLTGNEDATASLLNKTLLEQVINGSYGQASTDGTSSGSGSGSAADSGADSGSGSESSSGSGSESGSGSSSSSGSSSGSSGESSGSGDDASSKSSKNTKNTKSTKSSSSSSSSKVNNGDEAGGE